MADQKMSAEMVVEQARRINELLESRVWKKDLEPLLAGIQADVMEALIWSPAASENVSASAMAVRDAYLKGRHRAIADIGERIISMQMQGSEAIKRLQEKDKA